ncbi:uncharacterized protein LOC123293726 [Chrysoperla carnea]|uniref:uncharacterized protein LOC123293726 n=1 Tax=Chrysoperla carnea TaxID=189513 RepID=UPI001D06BF78|nr:uncharacterized protein LOC123293726 [Chrysoperla carnea]
MNYNNTEYNKEGKDDMASTNSSSGIDKDSSTTGTTSQDCHDSKIILDINKDYGKPGYPFPLVLRLRVLQIVCGITAVVMGAVACIEERGKFNLSIGIPTGITTILAASFSIYCSRGFGGYQPRPFRDEVFELEGLEGYVISCLRVLGPLTIAIPTILFWIMAFLLHVASLFLACKALSTSTLSTIYFIDTASSTLEALSIIFIILSTVVLTSLLCILKIELTYDPD